MSNQFAPIARIFLRYLVGAALMGSPQIGQKLAADPDLVMLTAAGIGIGVEGFYIAARKFGWAK